MRVIQEHLLYNGYGGSQTIEMDEAATILEVNADDGHCTLVVMADPLAVMCKRRFFTCGIGGQVDTKNGPPHYIAPYRMGELHFYLFELNEPQSELT